MSPRAGDSHQVGGEFPKDHFEPCLCVGSPLTRVRVGCGNWAFTLSAETVSDIVLGLEVWMHLGRGMAFS